MHMQGGQRGEKVAQPGTTVHEGNHIHEYEVVDAGYHNVTLRHKASGKTSQYSEGEFDKIFEKS